MCSSQQSNITFSKEYEKIDTKQLGNSSLYVIKNTDDMIVTPFKQLYNPAPTLPIHSPHSPGHLNSYPNIHQRKLSGRYIDNKMVNQKSAKKLLSAKQMTENPGFFSEGEKLTATTTRPSKVCRCTKPLNQHDCIRNSAINSIVKDDQKCDLVNSMHGNVSNQKDKNVDGDELHIRKNEISDFKFKKINKIASKVNPQPRYSLGAQDNHNRPECIIKTSKSEQTSPNIVDYKRSIFDYVYNKSTDSLLRVSSMDPWIKKNELLEYGVNEVKTSSADPWIKRPSSDHKKSPCSKERFKNGQLISGCAKSDFLLEAKQKSYLKPDMPQQKILRNGESILSAPPSPNSKNAYNSTINYSQSKSFPTKSASFSPARGKPLLSSFEDSLYVNLTSLQSTPIKSNYVKNQKQLRFTENITSNHLNVYTSNNLQCRHSFSSLSKPKDELQLNIRRLSEQMSQMDYVQFLLTNNSNVNNKEYDVTRTVVQNAQTYEFPMSPTELNITDNIGFKKILKFQENCHTAKNNPKFSTVLDKTKLYISQQEPNPMPETTC
ncbi:uncharacterized protein LOC111600865 isoform X1 [Drosophila hydei]|uniref:Uncharacterized protein LOC111600865 isoform X1 n=1 Tax=Drosophila hydei TaxID=7224 RepID=A0A6J1LZR4_DROHY|nr:uncharacterized protein LOC111600865 isoform X1 [Drosophila hydei]